MADLGVLSPLLGAIGSGLLKRTYFLQTDTPDGFPNILAVLDAVVEENPTYSAIVTQHPVEAGKEITDHIQIKSTTLTLKGTISNSPLDLGTSIGNLLSGGIGIATSAQARSNILNTGLQQAAGIGAAALVGGASEDILSGAADALSREVLLNVFDNKTPFAVITRRQRFDNMVIENMRFPRDSSTGFQLAFEMDLVEIRIVTAGQVELQSLDEGVVAAATKVSKQGSQVSKVASAPMKSLLGKAIKGFTGTGSGVGG